MQSQTATLAAAARARKRVPAVTLIVRDKERRWAAWHTNTGTPTAKSTRLCIGQVDPAKIARARVNGTAIERQQIADPTAAAGWWSWTAALTGVEAGSQLALAKGYTAGTTYLYHWQNSAGTLRVAVAASTDDGATYGSPAVLDTLTGSDVPDTNRCLASAGKGDFWYLRENAGSYYISGMIQGAGGWSARISSPAGLIPWYAACGLAAAYYAAQDRYIFAVTYQDSSGDFYCSVVEYRATLNTWSAARTDVLPIGGPVANLALHAPTLCWSADGMLHLAIIEQWTDYGTNNSYSASIYRNIGGYYGTTSTHNWAFWGWASLIDMDMVDFIAGGMAEWTDEDGQLWLIYALENEIHRARTYSAANANTYAEYGDVLDFTVAVGERYSYMTVDLDNRGNQFASFGTDGETGAPIRPFAEAQLYLGYVTSAGPEQLLQPLFWIETAELLYLNPVDGSGPSSRLRLHCVGIWRMLEQWTAPHTMAWSNQTIFYLLKVLAARAAGQTLTTDGNAAFGQTVNNTTMTQGPRQGEAWRWRPEWIPHDEIPFHVYTVNAGTTALEQLYKLLVYAGAVLRQSSSSGLLCTKPADQATTSLWDVGAEVERAAYGVSAGGVNRARARTASGTYAVEWVDAATAAVAGRLVDSIDDLTALAASAPALNAVEGDTYRGMWQTRSGYVTVPLVPGLELWDRITITDPLLSTAAISRRVGSLLLRYDSRRALYSSRVGLLAR